MAENASTVRLPWLAALAVTGLVVVACAGGSGRSGAPTGGESGTASGPTRTSVAKCPATTRPDAPGPVDQPRPAAEQLPVAMDGRSGRLVSVEAHPQQLSGTTTHTWTFDVCTNTWRLMKPSVTPRQVRILVYDAGAALTVAFPTGSGARPWTYSLDRDTWQQQPAPPRTVPPLDHFADAVYDPTSGQILLRAVRNEALWSYQVATNSWHELTQGDVVPTDNTGMAAHHHPSLVAYDTVVDKLVLTMLGDGVDPGETWTFDPRAHRWARQRATPPRLDVGESGREVTFDPATGRTVVFSGGVLATYDAAADRWASSRGGAGWPTPTGQFEGLPTGPLTRYGHSLAYDPVNQRVLLVDGLEREGASSFTADADVWGLDVRSQTWTELAPKRL